MSLDTARTSDVVEKVCVHRSSKKASAISGPTRDRKDAVDHFISPKRAQENCSGTFSTTSLMRAASRLVSTLVRRRILHHSSKTKPPTPFWGVGGLYIHSVYQQVSESILFHQRLNAFAGVLRGDHRNNFKLHQVGPKAHPPLQKTQVVG